MPNFKKIRDYSPAELNSSVEHAELYCKDKGLEFYRILNGIDAYFERRRRKEENIHWTLSPPLPHDHGQD